MSKPSAPKITLGRVVDQISENRSKIAVYETLLTYLRSNYLPSDAGRAEMSVLRPDYAMVQKPDIEKTIADICDRVAELRAELLEWENLTVVQPRAEEPEPEEATVAAGPAIRNKLRPRRPPEPTRN
jgi:hypothetical protein